MAGQVSQEIAAPLSEADIRSGIITRRIGLVIHLFQAVDSTNDEAKALAVRGALEGTVVIADAQERGRGRMGRSWTSPPGVGVYFSVILRPAIQPHAAPALSLLGAAAVAEAIEAVAGLAAGVKWPNDLIVRGRKVGGILGEVAAETSHLDYVVLGIGINVNQTEASFEGELRHTATSLRIEAGRLVDRTAMIRSLCESLDRWYNCFLSEGLAPIIERLRQSCLTLGQRVVARSGDQQLCGLAVDLDHAGALLIRDADQRLHRLIAGDVTLTG
ncbi:MAG: biotin--[acetyl-CoA-carboxylase] ligase [candidate division NC10 bacterium]|nr:biotin--[acetyl-CoA-carboxylase] ligase [candidate division NC10 bacterium]